MTRKQLRRKTASTEMYEWRFERNGTVTMEFYTANHAVYGIHSRRRSLKTKPTMSFSFHFSIYNTKTKCFRQVLSTTLLLYTLLGACKPSQVYKACTVTHLSTNGARRRLTSLIETTTPEAWPPPLYRYDYLTTFLP